MNNNRFRRFDDIVGPITEGSDNALYIFSRQWDSRSKYDAEE